jgi:lipoprotein-anchoring transpeptidase ErfK/SrfK
MTQTLAPCQGKAVIRENLSAAARTSFGALLSVALLVVSWRSAPDPTLERTGAVGTATVVEPGFPAELAPALPAATEPEELDQNHMSIRVDGAAWAKGTTGRSAVRLDRLAATAEGAGAQQLRPLERGRSLGSAVPSNAPPVDDASSQSRYWVAHIRDREDMKDQTTSAANAQSDAVPTGQSLQPASNPPPAEEIVPFSDISEPPTLVGRALVVDQDAQVLRVYMDGVEIRALPVSTGVPPLYTPAFRGHVGRYVSTIYGYGGWADNAWYVLTASGNIYIHGAPYTFSEGARAYEGMEFLGLRPSSHGCVRLHPADAEWLTQWNPEGVPILITPLDLNREW